jgi:hypothetical protein
MSQQLYPRPVREKPPLFRRWRVDYDLAYDFHSGEWSGYYPTRPIARIAAWWNVHVSSWGGSAVLVDQILEEAVDR